MLTVKNKRTGVIGIYPKRQAEWLVSTGRCELVVAKPETKSPTGKNASRKKTKAQSPETKISDEKKPEDQGVDDQSSGVSTDQNSDDGSSKTEGATDK